MEVLLPSVERGRVVGGNCSAFGSGVVLVSCCWFELIMGRAVALETQAVGFAIVAGVVVRIAGEGCAAKGGWRRWRLVVRGTWKLPVSEEVEDGEKRAVAGGDEDV